MCRGLLLVLLGLAGCATLPAYEPLQTLDERSGVSLLIVAEPLVFARERRDVAVNARDYLTIVAVERNRAGKRDLLLIAYRWSTIDRRVGPLEDAQAQALVLLADDRDWRLLPQPGKPPAELWPRAELHAPPVGDVRAEVYRADRSMLESIVEGGDLGAFFADAPGSPVFRLWRDGRQAWRAFLAALAAGSG